MKKTVDLANELEVLPEKILNEQLEIINLIERIDGLASEIDGLEIEIKGEVLVAVDESGKKAHPNDEARKIAFIGACKEKEGLQELIRTRSELSTELQIKKASLEMLNSRQRNLRVLIEFFHKLEAN